MCLLLVGRGWVGGVLTTKITAVAVAVEVKVEVDVALVVAVAVAVANVVDAALFETRLRSRMSLCRRGPWRQRWR